MKYFVYIRKSTEQEERQALSLASQAEKARQLFPGLELIELPPESASAFKPYNRPIFDDMLRRIDAGEAHGVISWHPDRISRNEIDASAVTYRVRTGAILDLKFGSYTFDNSPEGMMMLQMTMSQSQYSSAKLSKDVKRGNEKKLSLGWKPGWAPTGYLNTPDRLKGDKVIIKDPERFDIVRKIWDLMLTGNYSVPEILDVATFEWGFRTRKTRRQGGGPITVTGLHGVLHNVFYTGNFLHNGQLYSGSHEPMITLAEYDRVQSLLGSKGRPRPKTRTFTYRGPLKCGECGCTITAELKLKYIRSTKETKEYTYYHCTHRKPCSQKGAITEEAIVEQIDAKLEKITIMPQFRDWALSALRNSHEAEVKERSALHQSQSNGVIKTQQEIDTLTTMRLRDLIDDEEYIERREKLTGELRRLKEILRDTEGRAEKWLELTEQTFDFAANARSIFSSGTEEERRQMFTSLGGSMILKDKILEVDLYPWFTTIEQKYPQLEREFKDVITNNIDNSDLLVTKIQKTWLPTIEAVITTIKQDLVGAAYI